MIFKLFNCNYKSLFVWLSIFVRWSSCLLTIAELDRLQLARTDKLRSNVQISTSNNSSSGCDSTKKTHLTTTITLFLFNVTKNILRKNQYSARSHAKNQDVTNVHSNRSLSVKTSTVLEHAQCNLPICSQPTNVHIGRAWATCGHRFIDILYLRFAPCAYIYA